MTVRDGPGAAHTPWSRKARAGRGAPPTTAPAPSPLRVAARELEGVDVVDQREGQRLAQFGRCGPTRVAVEAATHDEAGAGDDHGLDHGQDEEVEHEVAPETAGVGRVHVEVVIA